MERLERDFFRTIKILVEIMGDDFWIFKSVSELKLLKYCKLSESQFKNDCLFVSSPYTCLGVHCDYFELGRQNKIILYVQYVMVNM